MFKRYYVFWLLAIVTVAFATPPEQGKFIKSLNQDITYGGFVKTLYKSSTVRLKITKATCDDSITLTWLLRSSSCYGEYEAVVGDPNPEDALQVIFLSPDVSHNIGKGYYLRSRPEVIECNDEHTAHVLNDFSSHKWTEYPSVKPTVPSQTTSAAANNRRRRENSEGNPDPANTVGAGAPKADASSAESKVNEENVESPKSDKDKKSTPEETDKDSKDENSKAMTEPPKPKVRTTKNNNIAVVRHTAPYILIVHIEGEGKFSVEVNVEMETPLGYLSAHEYPLKTFYMIMCIVYSLYAAAWLVMSACNFRDLLRVQFWIGGVILLGMIEKAVFYSEYLTINSTGVSVMGAVKFAEVVSALKRSLARMLVIIVSLGFGIVKPRLGPMLHRVIGIGILYFIVAIVEALVRNDASTHPGNKHEIFAEIPLAIIDSIICWWIFMSLMQTMKTLRLRRNVVKLSLYRHFSNTIIFCVIASLAMIAYSFRYRDACETAWQDKWIDDAFWHILFSIILLVIMVLWRPNVNNQRYAFSPLLDADVEEGAEEPMLGSGATETVKMRGLKNVSERRDPASNAEENLKWIEENIPETIADAALPAIMDSDEEIVASKYEMSKME